MKETNNDLPSLAVTMSTQSLTSASAGKPETSNLKLGTRGPKLLPLH